MARDTDFSWRRSLAWAFTIGLHAAVLLALLAPPRVPEGNPTLLVTLPEPLQWLDVEASVAVALPDVPETAASAATAAGPRAVAARQLAASEPARRTESLSAERSVRLFDDEGRALLLHQPLFAATPAPREGSFFTPGDGSEDDVFYRPLALEPRTTRFAEAWRPTETLLDGLNRWLGDKLVREVHIPLNPKFNLVCVVSVTGVGSCIIKRMGGTGVIVERGPPPPWERAQRVQCVELRRELAASDDAVRVAFLLERLAELCVDPAAAP